MKIWKKNLIAAAVLVTVCAGIYMNWLYSEDQAAMNLTDTLDAEKILSSDMLVMAGDTQNPEELVNTVTDYFAAVRLSRQEARDSAVSLIQEAMSYDREDGAAQTNAQLELIVQTALTEAQIESLVIAKGYADCVVFMSENSISVVVSAAEDGLQTEDVAKITDIVLSETTYAADQIKILETN